MRTLTSRGGVAWRRRVVFVLVFALLIAVPIVAGALGQPFYIRLFTRIMILGLAAISLDLLLGYGGMVSLGHAAFVGVGAYSVGILAYHADNGGRLFGLFGGSDAAWIVWPVAVAVGGFAAFVVGLVSLRTRGFSFIMITLAFAQMIYYFFVSWQTYGGDDGLQMMSRNRPIADFTNVQFYWLVLVCLLLATLLVDRVIGSRFGMVLRGARQNDRRMRAIGVPVYRYRLAAFTLAGAIAAFSGVLLANSETFVSPATMSWLRSAELIVMVVMGGMGTVHGGIIGAAVDSLLELILGNYTEHWQIIFGPFFILVVLFARRGFLSLVLGESREG